MTAELIALTDAAKLLPKKSGKPFHANTLYRWAGRGIQRRGRRVRLQTERIGNQLFTTPEWVHQFTRELSDGTEPLAQPLSIGTPAAVRMRMQQRGFDGPQKSKVSRLPSQRPGARALSPVLPDGAVRDPHGADDGTRVSGREAVASQVHDTAERLSVALGAAVVNEA